MKKLLICLQIILLFAVPAHCQRKMDKLQSKLDSIAKKYKGIIGVSVTGIEEGYDITVNNTHPYPMQSVFKFPLALAVLHEVDMGNLSLNQKIHINKEDLHVTWSPLRDKYPNGNIDLTLAEVLDYTVSKSDNNTCDILFKLVKGTKKVNSYVHVCGAKNITIAATEVEMSTAWQVQYTNHAEPSGLTYLLKDFYKGKLLRDTTTQFLMNLMINSENSPKRIKGLLPPTTIVAHKTGTSNTNDKGMTAAVNDVGIVTLPGGNHFAIAVFVSNTRETKDTAEKIIAEIAKVTYDYFADTRK